MNQAGYEEAFARYQRYRDRYDALQAEVQDFLLRFTGEVALHKKDFVLRDLARMEGLRMQRNDAYKSFVEAEEAVFERLSKPWGPNDSNDE